MSSSFLLRPDNAPTNGFNLLVEHHRDHVDLFRLEPRKTLFHAPEIFKAIRAALRVIASLLVEQLQAMLLEKLLDQFVPLCDVHFFLVFHPFLLLLPCFMFYIGQHPLAQRAQMPLLPALGPNLPSIPPMLETSITGGTFDNQHIYSRCPLRVHNPHARTSQRWKQ